MNKWFFVQDILPILGCFWCFGCYFSWKPFFWPNVLYMVRKLLMWGLIWCIEHSISIISQRLWIAVTRWDNFDSCNWTLVLRQFQYDSQYQPPDDIGSFSHYLPGCTPQKNTLFIVYKTTLVIASKATSVFILEF